MKPTNPSLPSRAGFSLIELIGVLAIMAILAAAIAPNAVRMIDRAAVRAEQENLRNFGEQVKLYLKDSGNLPASNSWASALGAYADMNVADVQTNKRMVGRVYVLDPDATRPRVERVLLLSAMKNGLFLPAANTISTAQFDALWDTADDSTVPTAQGWGWSPEDARDYFVMQRINVAGIYSRELKSFTITLQNRSNTGSITTTTTTPNGNGNGNNGNGNGNGNGGGNGNGNNGNGNGNTGNNGNGNNNGGTTTVTTTTTTPALPASYRRVAANGGSIDSGDVTTGAPVPLTCVMGDRIELFDAAGAAGVATYIYVVSDHGASFEFDPNGNWIIR